MIARLPLSALATVFATLVALAPLAAHAQAGSPTVPTGPEPSLVQGEPESETKVPEPKIEHLVTEDSQVRIEETRVRGVPTRIVVHSKVRGIRGSYGIQPRDPSRLPQDDYSAGLPSLNFGF